jgi:hypothetical protein
MSDRLGIVSDELSSRIEFKRNKNGSAFRTNEATAKKRERDVKKES